MDPASSMQNIILSKWGGLPLSFIYIYTCSDREDRKAPKAKRKTRGTWSEKGREKERESCLSFLLSVFRCFSLSLSLSLSPFLAYLLACWLTAHLLACFPWFPLPLPFTASLCYLVPAASPFLFSSFLAAVFPDRRTQNGSPKHPKSTSGALSGQPRAPSCSSRADRKLTF